MNCKFKVGDKVKVTNADKHAWKRKYIGNIYTIDRVNPNVDVTFGEPHYGVAEPCMYVFLESELELVLTEKIVITHDRKTTTATMYRGDEKVVATARCAPEDKFDFMVGAKLAMERLNAEVNKRKRYNGKVVCIKTAYPNGWTVGKVYEVKDGIITTNYGRRLPSFGEPYRDAEDVRHAGYDNEDNVDLRHNRRNEFVPLIEG